MSAAGTPQIKQSSVAGVSNSNRKPNHNGAISGAQAPKREGVDRQQTPIKGKSTNDKTPRSLSKKPVNTDTTDTTIFEHLLAQFPTKPISTNSDLLSQLAAEKQYCNAVLEIKSTFEEACRMQDQVRDTLRNKIAAAYEQSKVTEKKRPFTTG
jgi:hypothetical protein